MKTFTGYDFTESVIKKIDKNKKQHNSQKQKSTVPSNRKNYQNK